ncbi:MAG TPA: hypothetical protein VGY53_03670, partial [Isosphaeraceae bacterium]|nr:hypothetical protein [Isosphaeraceae bacterium]
MKPLSSSVMDVLWHDADAREVLVREVVSERLALRPPPLIDDQVVATYFFAFRSTKLADAIAEISYH